MQCFLINDYFTFRFSFVILGREIVDRINCDKISLL